MTMTIQIISFSFWDNYLRAILFLTNHWTILSTLSIFFFLLYLFIEHLPFDKISFPNCQLNCTVPLLSWRVVPYINLSLVARGWQWRWRLISRFLSSQRIPTANPTNGYILHIHQWHEYLILIGSFFFVMQLNLLLNVSIISVNYEMHVQLSLDSIVTFTFRQWNNATAVLF